jgi:hypothetical protein
MKSTTKSMTTAKRALIAGMVSLTLFAGAGLTGLLAGPTPAYAERGTRAGSGIVVTPPRGTTTGTAERLSGHAWNNGQGQATQGECRAYAEAINGLDDENNKNSYTDELSYARGQVANGLYNAGQARGCTFLAY